MSVHIFRIIPRHPEDKETEEEEEDEEQTSETGKPQPFSYQKRKKTKRTDVLQDLNKTLQESLSHERRQQLKETVLEDEDKLFLLSLYKDLKSISPERKLMAKSELIEVLNRYNDFDSFSIHAAFLAPSHPSTFHRNSILTDDHSFGYHSYYQPVIRNENARSVNRSQKRISRKSVSSPSDSINDSEGSSISKMFMKRL